jgi:hypothetical protein
MKEPYPLAWPEGWQRTLLRDRRANKAWKDTLIQSAEKLRAELKKTKVLSYVISSNIPPSGKSFADVPRPADTGVAVWFSRERPDDYSWQETLHISSPSPTEAEILEAFKRLALPYHPDKPTADINIYHRYDDAKKRALDFIRRKTGANYQQVIAIDTFEEVRWNMRACQMSLFYLRGLENCGSAAILERAFEGFAEIPEAVSAATKNA